MAADFSTFQEVFDWVIRHGYPLMFLAMCAEGPTVTAAATFALTLGFFNPLAIFILSVLGDVVPDTIFYGMGYWGRMSLVKRFGDRVGLTQERLERLEKTIFLHGGKTIAMLKLTPVLAAPGLMAVGAMKMDLKKYWFWVIVVTLQKTLIFMAIGYFFGRAYNVSKYLEYGALIPFLIILLFVVIFGLYRYITKRIASNIEKM